METRTEFHPWSRINDNRASTDNRRNTFISMTTTTHGTGKAQTERNFPACRKAANVLACIIQCLIVVLAGLTMLGLADGIDFTTFNLFSAVSAPLQPDTPRADF
ncbi:MAG: hypothetical protein JNJ60_07995 [Rhodocyclaceae bacterium]|nr:hypothetical protein [Rhodocyclaceae bacterium]